MIIRAASMVLAVSLTLGATGCASTLVRNARSGDRNALATELKTRIDQGKLSRGEAADVARAVAEHEIADARGEAGIARIHELRSCARDLDDSLAARAQGSDPVAIEAAWARALYGDLSESAARDYASNSVPLLRAIAPLGYVRSRDGRARRDAMKEPLLEARRAAMRAAQKAEDPEDVPALAEAARLDPDPLTRSEAVRALVAIGGPTVAERLRDLWTTGDGPLRGDIAVAWASPKIYPYSQGDPLRTILATERGPGAIEAAAAVLRSPPASGANKAAPSAELRAQAVSALLAALENDARRARLHAIAMMPVVAPPTGTDITPLLTALRKAATDTEIEIKVAALSRLLDSPPDRGAAIVALEPIAGQERGKMSNRALFALAAAGHMRIQAWLERDLGSSDPDTRVSALISLAALGRAPRGAALLADADPSVRARASCALIAASRRSP